MSVDDVATVGCNAKPRVRVLLVALALTLGVGGCTRYEHDFSVGDPARGPGALAGSDEAINSEFSGGTSPAPEAAAVTLPEDGSIPDCDAACRAHCDGLGLDNPVDEAMCPSLWGVGLATQPIDALEACRRIYADLGGRLPGFGEVRDDCRERPLGEVVSGLMAEPEFVLIGQRQWADALRYNNEAVNFERIYDADALVGKLYRGEVAYDEFAAVISAHPVLTRRYDTPGDRAEALFSLLLGRPPYENERSDLARLYALWGNGYYDHPKLQTRLPDAVIEYRCIDEAGGVDDATKGECTSVLWGYNELILEPDFRAQDGQMWSGLLTAEEWEALSAPGRILSGLLGFWEHAVDDVLQQYLGYDLGKQLPEVRQRLIEYLLEHDGDLRAVHYAVATSQVYLQSTATADASAPRYTYGPFKQVEVETWIDSVKAITGYDLSSCDHRLPVPENLIESGFLGTAVVHQSRWDLGDDGDVVGDYRNLARTLGGCPDNSVGGRFKTISILTTATQLGFVTEVCNATLEPGRGAAIAKLLPADIEADTALDADLAESILEAQVRRFFGRPSREAERLDAREHADACAPKPCTAEAFARPLCYALLGGSEMLFY
ncbi:MAG: hypothetical protein OEZ06_27970 [Myxococcales bacterium]|nr:hypothetical protein [Myxococcales bacterium]